MEDEAPEPLRILECTISSRIDRFYVSTPWTTVVQQVEAQLPVSHSDHQQIRENHVSKAGGSRHCLWLQPGYESLATLDLCHEAAKVFMKAWLPSRCRYNMS